VHDERIAFETRNRVEQRFDEFHRLAVRGSGLLRTIFGAVGPDLEPGLGGEI
jgi:hypothetical protein